ncbi:MAG: DUF2497 domain-containing protein [Rhizobiaceae bacterium]
MAQASSAQREPSMEEILASIRKIIEDNEGQSPAEAGEPEAEPVMEAAAAEIATVEVPEIEVEQFRAELSGDPVETEDRSYAPPQVEPPVFQPRGEPAIAASPAVPADALVSAATGQKVAAAFGELTEAFAAQRRKSFDDMAEDMLRPMLRDWLDNNLPTLVERLVREEIEKISRGDRA